MTEAEVYAGLTDVVCDVLDDDTIVLTPNMRAQDVHGWDSLKMVAIMIAVEARFRIRIRSSEIDAMQSIGDLATLIRTKAA